MSFIGVDPDWQPADLGAEYNTGAERQRVPRAWARWTGDVLIRTGAGRWAPGVAPRALGHPLMSRRIRPAELTVPEGVREQLNEVLKRFSDREVVLFDTPGGSPRNSKQLEVLKEYLDAVETKDVYLAVASPTRYSDMLEVCRRFSIAPIDGLLFTKIDETDRFGPIVNLINETKVRLTYLTTGQNVPQDIELADSVKMAELLLSERAES